MLFLSKKFQTNKVWQMDTEIVKWGNKFLHPWKLSNNVGNNVRSKMCSKSRRQKWELSCRNFDICLWHDFFYLVFEIEIVSYKMLARRGGGGGGSDILLYFNLFALNLLNMAMFWKRSCLFDVQVKVLRWLICSETSWRLGFHLDWKDMCLWVSPIYYWRYDLITGKRSVLIRKVYRVLIH